MNEIEIKIDFTKGTLATKGIALITGDYASTMLKFTFDREDGTKVFEMKNPSDELVYVGEIINGEVLLTSKVDVTTIHNNKTYTKYTNNDAIYWYQPTDNKLFTDEWVEVATFNLEEYTKVQVNASLFSESGKYIFEVSLYKDDTKLTSTKGILPVKQEQVIVGDEIVEAYIPIFDELIQEINEKITETNNLDLDVTDTSGVVEATLTKKDGTTKTVEIIDRNDYYDKDEVDAIQTTIEAEIPTKVSELDNDSNFIDNTVNDLTNYTKTSDLGAVALSNDYDDLTDKPNLSIYSLITETGNKIDLEINSSTYVLTAKLYDKNNNLLSTSTGIDLPLETMVVGASYDSATKEIVLTLKNGQEVRFSVADLVSGLQTEITNDNKLSSDLVDDTGHTNKFVTSSEKTQITTNANNITSLQSGKEDNSNKVTSISSSSTDTQYPSAKCVYDSQDAQDTLIEDLQTENDYLNNVINQLPRVNGTGDTITLNNTIEAKMKSKLSPSEMEQETTTGKNLFNGNNVTTTATSNWGVSFSNNVLTIEHKTSYSTGTPAIELGILASGDYTISGTFGANLNLYRDNTYAQSLINGTTFNCNGSEEIKIAFSNNTSTPTLTYTNVQLELGSTPTQYEPYTGGIPAPNPQFPQPIHSVTGSNTIKVCGKNFFNIGALNSNNFPNATFTSNSITLTESNDYHETITGTNLSDISNLQVGQTYIITFDTTYTGSYNDTIYLRGSGTRWQKGTSHTITQEELDDRIAFYGTNNAVISNIMIRLSTESDTSYEPYSQNTYPLTLGTLEYSKIGNYEDIFMKLKYVKVSNDIYEQGSGVDASSTTRLRLKNTIRVTKGNKYKAKYIGSGASLQMIINTNQTGTYPFNYSYIDYCGNPTTWVNIQITQTIEFTATNDGYLSLIIAYTNNSNISPNDITGSDFIIEEFQENEQGQWYLKKNIGKVMLDGSESWRKASATDMDRFILDLTTAQQIYSANTSSLSNYFIYNVGNYVGCWRSNAGTQYIICFSVGGTTTLEQFKAWLVAHNTLLYQPYVNPEYILLNDTLQTQLTNIYNNMMSKKGTTNISQINQDLPFSITASALLDLSVLINE